MGEFYYQSEQAASTQKRDYLSFKVGGKKFGVPTEHIWGITKVVHLREVPEGPYYLKGMAEIRGFEVPVIDLGLKEDGPESAQSRKRKSFPAESKHVCVVVVTDPGSSDRKPHLGLLAESLEGLKTVSPGDNYKHVWESEATTMSELCLDFESTEFPLDYEEVEELVAYYAENPGHLTALPMEVFDN